MSQTQARPSNKVHTWFIYALKDPRDGTIRYIGSSTDLKTRFHRHTKERANTPKCRWIIELLNSNLLPLIAEIDKRTGTWSERDRQERAFIAVARQRGLPLLNVDDGGRGRAKTKIIPHLS